MAGRHDRLTNMVKIVDTAVGVEQTDKVDGKIKSLDGKKELLSTIRKILRKVRKRKYVVRNLTACLVITLNIFKIKDYFRFVSSFADEYK